MIENHVAAVAGCWLIGGAGLAMLLRATSWRWKFAAHGGVFLAMSLLSVMALDHVHHEHQASAVGTNFVAGNQSDWYHTTTCPIVARQKMPLVALKDEHEARDSGRSPHECVTRLVSHVQSPPEDGHDDDHQADSSE